MADIGVIALDPVRLGGLEVYLRGLGDGCRRRAGKVADEVAGSGLGADGPIAELERLAMACYLEGDEVAWRRAAIEALSWELPPTGRTYPGPAAAAVAAEALAARLADALAAEPPRWGRLAGLLAELDRSAGSASFAAAFFSALGPVRARRLPVALEAAWRHTDRAGPAPDPPAGAVLAAQQRFADALRTASRTSGPHALDERWCRAYAGLPARDEAVAAAGAAATEAEQDEAIGLERELRRAGYGLALAGTVGRAVGWRRAAAVLTLERGVLGLVTAPMALADGDGPACDGAEALARVAAAGVTIVGAVVPGAVVPAVLAAGMLTGVATVLDACRRQPPRRNETKPTVDPATGQSRLPSGHASNPHVDIAGVPLSPAYG